MLSYTTDFEPGLFNALEMTFPNVRRIGCFYHYSYNIRKNIKERILNTMDENERNNKDITNKMKNFLIDILMIPFKIQNNNNIVNEIFNKYKEVYYEKFKKYFFSQWVKYINNGILNYSFLKKEQRSNSYIENYNRRIKSELCKFILI